MMNSKKGYTYEPRTEAISPAINDDLILCDDDIDMMGSAADAAAAVAAAAVNGTSTLGPNATSKSARNEQSLLVEKLKKVEAEIMETGLQIARLKKQKTQLEQATANNHRDQDEDQENVCENTKQLSIAKLVYHENKAKAFKANLRLELLGGSMRDLPIYNQPSDNAIYHVNSAKYVNIFKKCLIANFKKRLSNRLKLEESVSEEYDRRMEKWLKKIEQEDSQPNKRIRDAKAREFFEKQFPELKKARESGERFSRVGQRVARSDAELDEILDGITEREDQDKKVKSYAVIPPMLEEMRSRKPKYINTNGYVEDIISEYKKFQIHNTWTDEEKDIFRESYLQNPKNFGSIATMTGGKKDVPNCVQYYYMSKKSENYKQMLKRQQKRRTRSFVRPAQQAAAAAAAVANSTATEGNESNKTVNGVSRNTTGGDTLTESGQEAAGGDQVTSIKMDCMSDEKDESDQDKLIGSKDDQAKVELTIEEIPKCCICSCEFTETNQSRNVTRSNHQLYGIGADSLKPGMRICYTCRFRHVRHPSFDEPEPDLVLEPETEPQPESEPKPDLELMETQVRSELDLKSDHVTQYQIAETRMEVDVESGASPSVEPTSLNLDQNHEPIKIEHLKENFGVNVPKPNSNPSIAKLDQPPIPISTSLSIAQSSISVPPMTTTSVSQQPNSHIPTSHSMPSGPIPMDISATQQPVRDLSGQIEKQITNTNAGSVALVNPSAAPPAGDSEAFPRPRVMVDIINHAIEMSFKPKPDNQKSDQQQQLQQTSNNPMIKTEPPNISSPPFTHKHNEPYEPYHNMIVPPINHLMAGGPINPMVVPPPPHSSHNPHQNPLGPRLQLPVLPPMPQHPHSLANHPGLNMHPSNQMKPLSIPNHSLPAAMHPSPFARLPGMESMDPSQLPYQLQFNRQRQMQLEINARQQQHFIMQQQHQYQQQQQQLHQQQQINQQQQQQLSQQQHQHQQQLNQQHQHHIQQQQQQQQHQYHHQQQQQQQQQINQQQQQPKYSQNNNPNARSHPLDLSRSKKGPVKRS